MSNGDLRLTILYENTAEKSELRSGWGFSALIEIKNQVILFDTGADKQVLSHNVEQLGVQKGGVDQFVLSHLHCDHVGGLSYALDELGSGAVYVPEGFPTHFIRKIIAHESTIITVGEATEVGEHAFSTGALEVQYSGVEFSEQGLILETNSGPVLVAGCAHPGIENMVKVGESFFDQHFHLVIGGFHLYNQSSQEIRSLGETLHQKVDKVCPCHCSGQKAQEIFKEEWQEDYLVGQVGRVIELPA